MVHMRKAFKFCRIRKRIRALLTSKRVGIGVRGVGWGGEWKGSGGGTFCFRGIMTITVESGLL